MIAPPRFGGVDVRLRRGRLRAGADASRTADLDQAALRGVRRTRQERCLDADHRRPRQRALRRRRAILRREDAGRGPRAHPRDRRAQHPAPRRRAAEGQRAAEKFVGAEEAAARFDRPRAILDNRPPRMWRRCRRCAGDQADPARPASCRASWGAIMSQRGLLSRLRPRPGGARGNRDACRLEAWAAGNLPPSFWKGRGPRCGVPRVVRHGAVPEQRTMQLLCFDDGFRPRCRSRARFIDAVAPPRANRVAERASVRQRQPVDDK